MYLRIGLRWMSVAAGLLALSGCAMVILLSLEPDQRAALFLVPGDKAVVYIYHDDTTDNPTEPVVHLDGEPLGQPTTAGFWYREVVPGRHTVTLAGVEAEGIVLEVEAGRVYFVGEDVDCAPTSLPYLHAVREAAGRARVRALVATSKLPPSEAGEAAATACGPAAKSPEAAAL